MKKFILIIIIFITLILLYQKNIEKQSNSIFSGQIENNNALLGSKVGGRVIAIFKKEGDFVNKGDLIIKLDDEEQKLQVDSLEAKYKQVQSQYQKLSHGYRAEDIASAQADLELKRAILNNTELYFKRIKQLIKTKSTSPQNYDDAKSEFLKAQASFNVSSEKLKLMKSGYQKEDIQQAKDLIQEIKSNLDISKFYLEETKIIASKEGIIQNITVQIGEIIPPNKGVIELSFSKEKYAKFYIPETKLSLINKGDEVNIKIDGDNKFYKGKIFFISENAEFTPKNISTKEERENLLFLIKAKIDNKNLKSGMIIEVTLP